MKTRAWLLAAILICGIIPYSGKGQCANTIRTVSYDTTVTGVGSTGGVPFNFTFPKFDGSLGTLTEVQLSSRVTLTFNYDIENNLNIAKNHRLRIERYDEITSSVLSAPLESSYITPWRNHNLAASDGVVGSGTDFMSVPPFYIVNNYTIIDQVYYNTGDFIGDGTVSFDYNTSMYRTTDPATGAQINNDASNDEITFTVSYTYCDNIVMNPGPPRVRPQEREEIRNRITPNPSHTGNFTVFFDKRTRGDWQVELYSTNGQLVSRKFFYNALNANVISNRKLPGGIYFVKATHLKSHEGFVERLIVR